MISYKSTEFTLQNLYRNALISQMTWNLATHHLLSSDRSNFRNSQYSKLFSYDHMVLFCKRFWVSYINQSLDIQNLSKSDSAYKKRAFSIFF